MSDAERAGAAWERLAAAVSPTFLSGLAVGAVLLLVVLVVWRSLAWRLFAFDERIRRLRAQQKSAEVRLGQLTEALAPLVDEFPVDPTRPGTSTLFLGQPVDYVHFDPDEGVTFVEIKSADSKLSPKQVALRRRVEAGDVFWETFRIDGRSPEH